MIPAITLAAPVMNPALILAVVLVAETLMEIGELTPIVVLGQTRGVIMEPAMIAVRPGDTLLAMAATMVVVRMKQVAAIWRVTGSVP